MQFCPAILCNLKSAMTGRPNSPLLVRGRLVQHRRRSFHRVRAEGVSPCPAGPGDTPARTWICQFAGRVGSVPNAHAQRQSTSRRLSALPRRHLQFQPESKGYLFASWRSGRLASLDRGWPPNKRLKLTGGDRSKGSGVVVPWRAPTVVHFSSAGERVARSLSAIR